VTETASNNIIVAMHCRSFMAASPFSGDRNMAAAEPSADGHRAAESVTRHSRRSAYFHISLPIEFEPLRRAMTNRMFERIRNRKQRRAYREVLARWNADGGDARFRFAYDLMPDSVVLDVGGYEGQWSSDLYARQRCRIHIFEPVRRFAESIDERFSRNPDIQVHAFALGKETRTQSLSLAGASSSTHKSRHDKEDVEFRDVKEWFDEAAPGEIALMKINIEGGEYELLERMLDTNLVKLVSALQIQFHYFVENAEARMTAIQERLAATHRPAWQYRYIWENWERKDTGA
jgi:FkbM family methyltransferase